MKALSFSPCAKSTRVWVQAAKSAIPKPGPLEHSLAGEGRSWRLWLQDTLPSHSVLASMLRVPPRLGLGELSRGLSVPPPQPHRDRNEQWV